ncbi:outer membrane family protein [Helicobacter cetorum]|uniref:outer membrane family protein n=1 Tax=Helicobacter cetorum TaxID=138563 RepID=UPI000CF0F695|nr:outer membrane family protein [Helicobacter cetorum]
MKNSALLRNKVFYGLCSLGLLSSLGAYDYKISIQAESFSKVGFNNNKINVEKGIYPTETFVTTVGQGNIFLDMLSNHLKNSGHSLEAKVGGTIGGVAYDSTKFNQGGSVIYNYIGYWNGYLGGKSAQLDGGSIHQCALGSDGKVIDSEACGNAKMNKIRRNYVFNNAYLEYRYKDILKIKGGRYESSAPYMSGYTQGFEISTKFKDKNEGTHKMWWFSSWGRAFAYGQYLYDFYSPRTVQLKYADGSVRRTVNYGIHLLSYTYERKGISINPFFQFSPGTYYSPGVILGYDTNPNFDGVGFRSETKAIILLPVHAPLVRGNYRYAARAGTAGQSLLIRQRFDYNEFNFGGAFYKVWKNANAYIGTTGNPLGIDFWANSVYDIGQSMSHVVTEDAISGWVFGGGVHKKFLWGTLWRWTSSTIANEASVAVNVGYKITKNLSANLKLEYFGVMTHSGYMVGSYMPTPGSKALYSDRSHLMTTLSAKF